MERTQKLQSVASIQFLQGPQDSLQATLSSEVVGASLSSTEIASFQHNLHYLLFTWLVLIATILILGMLTAYLLKRKDASG